MIPLLVVLTVILEIAAFIGVAELIGVLPAAIVVLVSPTVAAVPVSADVVSVAVAVSPEPRVDSKPMPCQQEAEASHGVVPCSV